MKDVFLAAAAEPPRPPSVGPLLAIAVLGPALLLAAASVVQRNLIGQPRDPFLQQIVWGLMIVTGAMLLICPAILWRARRARFAAECQAYDAELRLRGIFACTIDAMLIITQDGHIASSNGAAATLFGYGADELLGAPVRKIAGLSDMSDEFAGLIDQSSGRLARNLFLDASVRHRDGHRIPVDATLGMMRFSDQLHFVATLRDISERKATERLKDEAIATASHELRAPLTSVAGSLGLLRAGAIGELPDAARRLIAVAERNSQRLIDLINDILDIEKIGAGQMRFERCPLDLDRVVRDAVEDSSGPAEARNVRLALSVVAAPISVDGDADRLMQVMTNLLSNAIRVSPAGGTVRILIARTETEATVSVEDDGPGVPSTFEPRLFERFAQSADGNGGTGLGLAISREIVNAQGGRIWFEHAQGGGASFSFALPLTEPFSIAAGRSAAAQ